MKNIWKTPCINSGLTLKRGGSLGGFNIRPMLKCGGSLGDLGWTSDYDWWHQCNKSEGSMKERAHLRAKRIAADRKREKGKGKEDDIEAKKHNEAVGAGKKKGEAKKGAVDNFDLLGEGKKADIERNHKRAKNHEETPKKKMRGAGVGEKM